ncbi:hypothetical protein OPT61_g10721 [Boeremia exigua]|uniref:Uncharacterized protein n=1 Tax=Boeremia exigua TaxID=749465 RepID=A0ACC2HN82_9PLEO|nr:hypothetical protein OPT61_g10721 [Boeremia exigua]
MNSLNALANIGTPPASPARSRRGSEGNVLQAQPRSGLSQSADNARADIASLDEKLEGAMASGRAGGSGTSTTYAPASEHEKTPLLNHSNGPFEQSKPRKRWLFPKRIYEVPGRMLLLRRGRALLLGGTSISSDSSRQRSATKEDSFQDNALV